MNREIFFGVLICIAALYSTYWSYDYAIRYGEENYRIAVGAILFGAILFLRGLIKRGRPY